MKVSSCNTGVAPPNTTMIASDNQLTTATRPRFQRRNAIWTIDATIATLVAKKMPCHLKAMKKRMSGKKSASNCITVDFTMARQEPARSAADGHLPAYRPGENGQRRGGAGARGGDQGEAGAGAGERAGP